MNQNRLVGFFLAAMRFAFLSAATVGCGVVSAQQTDEPPERIGLGFEAGKAGMLPTGWFVPTGGWKAELTSEDASDGQRSIKLSLPGQSSPPFGNLMRMIDATPYQGRSVRLSAKIRISKGDKGHAMMWLRVDRPDRKVGFFDNMSNRPIRSSGWSEAIIKGKIAADATQIALGVLSQGQATVWVDDMEISFPNAVPLQAPSPPRVLTDRGVENLVAASRLFNYVRFFHPSDPAIEMADWNAFAIRLMEAAEPANDPAELAERLGEIVATVAPSVALWPGESMDAPAYPVPNEELHWRRYWVHHGAGRIAEPQSMYSSSLGHLRIDDDEVGAINRLSRSLGNAILGDDSDPRPTSPEVVKSLGGGVCCRIPLMVAVAEPAPLQRTAAAHSQTAGDPAVELNVLNRSTRLAAVANCWGVMQHFYPYFDVVETDWDEALSAALASAAEDSDLNAFLHTLQQLLAKLHDGHGNVFHRDAIRGHRLPVRLDWSGEAPTVIGTHESAREHVESGDVIIAIDGKSIQQWREVLSTRISSATDGWNRYRLSEMLCTETATTDPCPVQMRKPDGSQYRTRLPLRPMGTRIESAVKKPDNGSQLAPDIVYFDLNGASRDAWNDAHDQLREAKGIVFDLRGYPSEAAMRMLVEISDQRMTSARWNVPVVTMPDREGWTWRASSWDLQPVKPKLKAEIAFLTDGRAISYAETVMGIVENYKLGEIVGGITAGTNGNVNPFSLPGDYRVSWTGMKVLKHDGSQHHGVGIRPSLPIEPTPAGIAAGNDEVLEKAVEILMKKIAAVP